MRQTALWCVLLVTVVASALSSAHAEEVLAQNEAASDVGKHRAASYWLGRLTQDARAAELKKDRTGAYDVAQSFELAGDARITAIEIHIVASKANCSQGVKLSLCADADGHPSGEPVTPDATSEIDPVRETGFYRFVFKAAVEVTGKTLYWLVLTKPDESGETPPENPHFTVHVSGRDELGNLCDWYQPGSFALRGPYKDADTPCQWRPASQADLYFRILGDKAERQ